MFSRPRRESATVTSREFKALVFSLDGRLLEGAGKP